MVRVGVDDDILSQQKFTHEFESRQSVIGKLLFSLSRASSYKRENEEDGSQHEKFELVDKIVDAEFIPLCAKYFDLSKGAVSFYPGDILSSLEFFHDKLLHLANNNVIFEGKFTIEAILASLARKIALRIAQIDMSHSSMTVARRIQLKELVYELQEKYGGEKVKKEWKKLISGPFELALAVLDRKKIIFCGGSSNYIDENGVGQRGIGRDYLNRLFDADKDIDGDGKSDDDSIVFYDPQIHLDTHGREYNYNIDGPTEALARDLSEIAIYEIANTTVSFVTMMEIIRDVAKGKKIVFWMGDKFIPIKPNHEGDKDKLAKILEVHLATFFKAESSARSYFMKFAKQFKEEGYPINFEYVTDSETTQKRKRKPWFDDENNKTELHFDIYKDLFCSDVLIRALMRIAERKQTTIIFHDISEGKEDDVSLLKERYENPNSDTKDLRLLQEGANFYQRYSNKMRDLFFRWHKTKKYDYEMKTEDENPNPNVAQLAVDGGSAAEYAKNRIMPIPEGRLDFLKWLLHEDAD